MQDSNLFQLVQSLLQDIVSFIPNLVGALLIIIIGWIISRILRKALKKFIKAIGIDKLGEQIEKIDIIHKAGISIKPSNILSSIIYYLMMLIFIVAATDVLGMPAISGLMSDVLSYAPNLIVAILIMGIGLLISEFFKNITETACKSIGISAYRIIANVVFYFTLINVLILALSQAGIDTGFLKNNLSIILAGIIFAFALGYGFASKDIASNFLASFYLKNRFKVGDNITISDISGKIVEIDSNYVKLKTDNSSQLIPIIKLITESVEIHD
ncbi:MAG: mechanosensitive ion channel [Bacteroidia bacterium]|nr:mechanosensitive ion channel [Bacteroidia bacterium]